MRFASTGTRPYNTASHASSRRIVSIHDHSNNIRTVGMGEFVGVLNGVEFRTRHNDYRLYMPSRSKGDYHATDLIPFPDVPSQVFSSEIMQQIGVRQRERYTGGILQRLDTVPPLWDSSGVQNSGLIYKIQWEYNQLATFLFNFVCFFDNVNNKVRIISTYVEQTQDLHF